MPAGATFRFVEGSAILLFLLQGVRVLLSSLFGLAYDVVFAGTVGAVELIGVAVCVVAACLSPLFVPRRKESVGLLLAAVLAAVARVVLTVNQPDARLWGSLLVTAAAGAFGATFLRRRPDTFATALALAFVIDQLLRAAGNTYDLSLRVQWLPVQVLLSSAACTVSWLVFRRRRETESPPSGGIDIASGLSIGALIFLDTSLLGFPNTLARWTGADYALVAPLLMVATLLPLLRSGQWGSFTLFVLTLLLGWMTGHKLHHLGVLAPMLLAQTTFVSSLWTLAQPSDVGHPRLSFALGMSLFLLFNVALAFAFTYPYTMSFFRDKGDYVFLIAVAILLVPALASRVAAPRTSSWDRTLLHWSIAIGIVVLTGIFASEPRLADVDRESDSFRVGTYNIHYGYDSSWRFSLEEQARTIERSGADIVLLQEVDAGRITSYGVDDALWLGRRLGMRHVFGPALEELSGVALLSRFPIEESHVQQLTSELEQTAMVHARVTGRPQRPAVRDIDKSQRVIDAYGTWLGLEPPERERQLADALGAIGDATPAVLAGDFNAPPGSPTYRSLQTAGFEDPFIALGLDGAPTSPAINPAARIDFVWTRGLDPVDAQVLGSLSSDHRMVVVELDLP